MGQEKFEILEGKLSNDIIHDLNDMVSNDVPGAIIWWIKLLFIIIIIITVIIILHVIYWPYVKSYTISNKCH